MRIRPVAFLTALLFAIHPLQVESVAWISASKILVYALFYLLALYFYIYYIEKRKVAYMLLSLLMFLLSFGGKEQAVILPLCLFVFDWLLKRDFNKKGVWIEKIPFFLLAVIMGGITLYIARDAVPFGGENYTVWDRIIFAFYSYLEYIFKWIFPVNLLYLYPFPNPPGEPLPGWMYIYPLLLLIMLVAFRKPITHNWPVTFGLLFFTVNIIMTIHLVPMPRFAIVADRYIYLSAMGLCFIFAWYLVEFYIKYKKYRTVISLAFTIIVLYWGVYTNIRTRVWRNTDTLKEKINILIEQREETDILKE